MLYSDIVLQMVIKFNQLSPETKIVIMQVTLIVLEIIGFFYIRHLTKDY